MIKIDEKTGTPSSEAYKYHNRAYPFHERTFLHGKNIICPIHVQTDHKSPHKNNLHNKYNPFIEYLIELYWNSTKPYKNKLVVEILDKEAHGDDGHHERYSTSEYYGRSDDEQEICV